MKSQTKWTPCGLPVLVACFILTFVCILIAYVYTNNERTLRPVDGINRLGIHLKSSESYAHSKRTQLTFYDKITELKNTDTKSKVYSIYGEGASLEDWKKRRAGWTPDREKLKALYRYLNLKEEEASLRLPLTLDPDHPYLLHNPNLCGNDVTDVLFIMHIRPNNFQRRTAFRKTVANESYFHPFTIRRLFLLGTVSDPVLQEQLREEHMKHGDLLQGQYKDDYHNLTHKGVMAFNWITHHCPHVRFVFKTDDDVFVDTFRLLYTFLPAFHGHHRSIVCTLWLKDTMAILRDGKWKVDDSLFAGLKVFPYNYCSGPALFFTGDMIPDLYAAAHFAPFFWIDDVYLYGILPALAGGMTFYYHHGPEGVCPIQLNANLFECLKKEELDCKSLAVTCRNEEEFYKLFDLTYTLHKRNSAVLVSRYLN